MSETERTIKEIYTAIAELKETIERRSVITEGI